MTKKGPFCGVDLCLSTIRNYITLKLSLILIIVVKCLSTIKNYITLKLWIIVLFALMGLSTIRNYITLKQEAVEAQQKWV